jgi:hypothetical protein
MKFAIGLLMLASLQAQSANFTCDNEDINFKNIFNLPGQGYWMQMAGKCDLTFTTVGGELGQRYNLCERKTMPITSQLDPFPIPGTEGQVYIHPVKGMSFYKLKDNSSDGQIAAKPFYNDQQLDDCYQSVGHLKGNLHQSGIQIRILTGRGDYRDYNMKRDPAGQYAVEPLGKPKPICSSFRGQAAGPLYNGKFYQTPILSRDGKMFAVRDAHSQDTVILGVGAGGVCSILKRIPFPTDKVTFGFDNKTVLFTTNMGTEGPNALMSLDLQSGKISPLSGPKENVLYMTMSEDGRVLYTRSLKNAQLSDSEAGLLVEMDPRLLKASADPQGDKALGALYALKCKMKMSTDQMQVMGRRLNQSACRDILAQATDADWARPELGGISRADLSLKCERSSEPHYEMKNESGAQ